MRLDGEPVHEVLQEISISWKVLWFACKKARHYLMATVAFQGIVLVVGGLSHHAASPLLSLRDSEKRQDVESVGGSGMERDSLDARNYSKTQLNESDLAR